jgi:hypothetical protein
MLGRIIDKVQDHNSRWRVTRSQVIYHVRILARNGSEHTEADNSITIDVTVTTIKIQTGIRTHYFFKGDKHPCNEK